VVVAVAAVVETLEVAMFVIPNETTIQTTATIAAVAVVAAVADMVVTMEVVAEVVTAPTIIKAILVARPGNKIRRNNETNRGALN
jgi:hypothetical protein